MKMSKLFLFSAFLILSFSACKKLGELCFNFSQPFTLTTNAVTAPGTVTVTKSVANMLSDQLSSKGASISNVNSVNVNPITVTIPANAGYTFADISAAEVTVNGQSIGKLPSGATGLVATFSVPTQGDVTAILKSATTITFVFTATFTKAIPASSLDVSVPYNTCYQVL